PRVRDRREPECVLVEVCGLFRVPDPQLDVIPPVDRHEVIGHDQSLDQRKGRDAAAGSPPPPSPSSAASVGSSNPFRSGTSFTPKKTSAKTITQLTAAARKAGWSASASATRAAGGSRCST